MLKPPPYLVVCVHKAVICSAQRLTMAADMAPKTPTMPELGGPNPKEFKPIRRIGLHSLKLTVRT